MKYYIFNQSFKNVVGKNEDSQEVCRVHTVHYDHIKVLKVEGHFKIRLQSL